VLIRPDSPLKPFSGRVLEREQITLSALDHGFYYDNERLPVVVTTAIEVRAEWRFVVVASKVVAGSEYETDGRSSGAQIPPDHRSWRYAGDLVAGMQQPDPVFVLDVCETRGGLRVMELNPFSGADLYNCDRRAVVAAVKSLTG